MKTRTGFVSNSSSASFVVNWEWRSSDREGTSLSKVLSELFDITEYGFDHETGCFEWNDMNEEFKEVIERIENNTIERGDGSFQTEVWTSMLNSFRDLGVNELLANLVINEDFHITWSKLRRE